MIDFTTKMINPALLYYRVTGKEKLRHNIPFDERTRAILSRTAIPVAIFIDMHLSSVRRVIVLIGNPEDYFLIRYARMLSVNEGTLVSVCFPQVSLFQELILKDETDASGKKVLEQFEILTNVEIRKELLRSYDLMLISMEGWSKLVLQRQKWLYSIPSSLIITS
jgi:hypothetical protein